MRSTLSEIVHGFICELGLCISRVEIIDRIEGHPEFPSLLCVTETLGGLGLDVGAFEIESRFINELPTPFIAHSGKRGDEAVLVKDRFDLTRLSEKVGEGGSIAAICCEIKESSSSRAIGILRKEYLETRARNWVISSLLLAALLVINIMARNLIFSFYYTLSLFGVLLSGAILLQELGVVTFLARSVCGASESSSCDTVVSSKQSNLFGRLKVSDLSLAYFIAQILSLSYSVVSKLEANSFMVYRLLGFFGFAVAVISVFVQWRVIRAWCKMCLIIVVVLIMQFCLLNFSSGPIVWDAIPMGSIHFLFCFLVCLLSIKHLRIHLTRFREVESELLQLRRFKYNRMVFQKTLFDGKHVDTGALDGDVFIAVGNKGHDVLIVTNPFCKPCADLHKMLGDFINSHEKDFNFRFRFNVDTSNVDGRGFKAASWMLGQIKSKEFSERSVFARELIERWYDSLTKGAVASLPANFDGLGWHGYLDEIRIWCDKNGIRHTPTIFIDGYEFPDLYSFNDLPFFLKGMVVTP